MGQSIFFSRYFLILLPVYFSLSLLGWLSLPIMKARMVGAFSLIFVLMVSAGYYFQNYYIAHHQEYNYAIPYDRQGTFDGHAFSNTARMLRQRCGSDEIVIHCSNPVDRSFSFFPLIYYNDRSLREYLYSVRTVPGYYGRQYLQPGDQIRSLQDIPDVFNGVWIITMDPPALLLDPAVRKSHGDRNIWLNQEDLPRQLIQTGFEVVDTSTKGRVTAIHYRVKQG